MKHNIIMEDLGPLAQEMASAVTKCVHCGFCLPSCPTYNLLGEEMDSPRGRIILMKSVLEGTVELENALPYIDRCLGCLGCVTACPSGVPYGELVMPFRSYAEERRVRSPLDRLARRVTRETLPHPARFKIAARMGRLAKPLEKVLPRQFEAMLDMLPDHLPEAQPLPDTYPAQGTRRARVALLVGCVQQSLAPEINWATLRVLSRNGVEVILPKDQGCCGGLALHTGDEVNARHLASINLDAFELDCDAIITNAAGCGSSLKDYHLLFKDTKLENEAIEFTSRVFDISVFLSQLGIEEPPPFPETVKVAYHDACHLAHAQGITAEPRQLLQQIPNVTIVPLEEGDLCCGSAGSYNIEHPDLAQQLGERKVENIMRSRAQLVVMGNIGCLVQIRKHLSVRSTGLSEQFEPIPVMHTIELLDKAYRGVKI